MIILSHISAFEYWRSEASVYGFSTPKSFWSPNENDSQTQIQGDIYASSLELCFLQLASILDTQNLILAGSELCSAYRRSAFLPAAASPAELALAHSLSLPYLLGGYGFESPLLNKKSFCCGIGPKHDTQRVLFRRSLLA